MTDKKIVCKDMAHNEIVNLSAVEIDCIVPRKFGVIVADYSFEQIATNGTSIMDDNFNLAFGLHRIAYAKSTPVGVDIIDYIEFVGRLCEMPKAFERYYELPDHVWANPNTRGIATSKNIVNRVVSFRLSSMTEQDDN
jgi:hypothetical protein